MRINTQSAPVSMLNKLLTDIPATGTESVDLEQVCQEIKHNLQHLLNARAWYCQSDTDRLPTVTGFGLPDFSHEYFNEKYIETTLCDRLAKTIMCYEPRLRNVDVVVLQREAQNRLLALRVTGLVQVQPEQAAVFESTMDLLQQRILFR